jgi:hypothetical protein
MRRYWVIVLGDEESVAWVLRESAMAWTRVSSSRTKLMEVGDMAVLFVSRSAYHNPARDESQLVAVATVTTRPSVLDVPVIVGGRPFDIHCNLRITDRLPERDGVPVKALIDQLGFVKNKRNWGLHFRSSLMEVPKQDFETMADRVRKAATP